MLYVSVSLSLSLTLVPTFFSLNPTRRRRRRRGQERDGERRGRDWSDGITDEWQERWKKEGGIIGGTSRFLACINV